MRQLFVLWIGATATGCAATSGNEWLNSPVDESALERAHATAGDNSTVQTDAAPVSPAPRPRLDHVVTLGESYTDSVSAPLVAASGAETCDAGATLPRFVQSYPYAYSSYPHAYVGPRVPAGFSAPWARVGRASETSGSPRAGITAGPARPPAVAPAKPVAKASRLAPAMVGPSSLLLRRH